MYRALKSTVANVTERKREEEEGATFLHKDKDLSKAFGQLCQW